MSEIDDLAALMKNDKFLKLNTNQQSQFLSEEMGRIYGDNYANRAPEEKQKIVNWFINENRPRSLVEHAVEFLPAIGPLAQHYVYGREVEPSWLTKKLFGALSPEEAALSRAAEDIFLLGASQMGVGLIGRAAGSALIRHGGELLGGEIFRTVPGMMAREGIVGGLYEVGKLVTDPPSSISEAAMRLGGATVGGAVLGGLGQKVGTYVGERLLRGRFIRELGSEEAFTSFQTRLGQGIEHITDNDIELMLNVAGNRTTPSAVALRNDARQLYEGKLAYDAEQRAAVQAAAQETALRERFRTEYETRITRLGEQEEQQRVRLEQERVAAGNDQQRLSALRAEEMRLQTQAQLERETTERQFAERVAEASRRPTEIEAPVLVEPAAPSPFGASAESEVMRQRSVAEQQALQGEQRVGSALEGSIAEQHQMLAQQFAQQERERLQAQAARRATRPTTDQAFVSRTNDEIEARLVREQARFQRQAAEQVVREEATRQGEANGLLAKLEAGIAAEGRMKMTRSESMLAELLRDETGTLGTNGFVGQHPVTLPIGMLRQSREGLEPVVVEKFTDGQAILRGGKGIVRRGELRMPSDVNEQALLDQLLAKENIYRTPSRDEAIEILKNRAAAEQSVRHADAHALREDFGTNDVAQRQEFALRRDAVMKLLQASGKEIAPDTLQRIASLEPFAGERVVGALENMSFKDAEQVQQALVGAGFENVRLAMNPEGSVNAVFTPGRSEGMDFVASLYTKHVGQQGIFDATQRTYGGLISSEHRALGEAFGYTEQQIKRFTNFIDQTLNDLSSRGIRVPARSDLLGVESIENQVLGKAKLAQPIRADAIVDANRLQRFEVGDTVRIPIGEDRSLLAQVSTIGGTESKQRQIFLQSVEPGPTMGKMLNPVSEVELRTMGAQREIEAPLGGLVQERLSPARTLEGLLNLEAEPRPFQPIEASYGAMRREARGLDVSLSQNRAGDISLTHRGMKLRFTGPDAVSEAAEFMNGMKRLRAERDRLINLMGGSECLS
jgi:flagellar biosynthesis/type III secretory pathway chaperone